MRAFTAASSKFVFFGLEGEGRRGRQRRGGNTSGGSGVVNLSTSGWKIASCALFCSNLAARGIEAVWTVAIVDERAHETISGFTHSWPLQK